MLANSESRILKPLSTAAAIVLSLAQAGCSSAAKALDDVNMFAIFLAAGAITIFSVTVIVPIVSHFKSKKEFPDAKKAPVPAQPQSDPITDPLVTYLQKHYTHDVEEQRKREWEAAHPPPQKKELFTVVNSFPPNAKLDVLTRYSSSSKLPAKNAHRQRIQWK